MEYQNGVAILRRLERPSWFENFQDSADKQRRWVDVVQAEKANAVARENLTIETRAIHALIDDLRAATEFVEDFAPELREHLLPAEVNYRAALSLPPADSAARYATILGHVLSRGSSEPPQRKGASGGKPKAKKRPSKNELEVAKLVKKHGAREGHELAIQKGLTTSAAGARTMAHRGRQK